jgi:hypothetical protein
MYSTQKSERAWAIFILVSVSKKALANWERPDRISLVQMGTLRATHLLSLCDKANTIEHTVSIPSVSIRWPLPPNSCSCHLSLGRQLTSEGRLDDLRDTELVSLAPDGDSA